MYIGIGRPQEKPPGGVNITEKIRRAFTFQGAKDAWREQHAKEIQEVTEVNSALTEEERMVAMVKLEEKAKKSAHIKVYTNYGALAAVTTAIVGEALLIANPKWAKGVEKFKVNIAGKDRHIFKPIGRSARLARTGIDVVVHKATKLRTEIRKRGEEALSRKAIPTEKNIEKFPVSLTDYYRKLADNPLVQMDNEMPVAEVVQKSGLMDALPRKLMSIFERAESEDIVATFFGLADMNGKWTPIGVDNKGNFMNGVTMYITAAQGFWREVDDLSKRGLVVIRELGGGNRAVEPTAALINLIKS